MTCDGDTHRFTGGFAVTVDKQTRRCACGQTDVTAAVVDGELVATISGPHLGRYAEKIRPGDYSIAVR